MDTDNKDLTILVFKAAELLYLELSRLFRPFNLTFEQVALLHILTMKNGISQKEISKSVYKDQANITRILRRLLDKGLVERKNSDKDKRLNLVFITEKGRALLRQLVPLKEPFMERMVGDMPEADQDMLKSLLEKLVNTMQDNNKEP
jgi:DNA-binding MarR family transcriptional regulator